MPSTVWVSHCFFTSSRPSDIVVLSGSGLARSWPGESGSVAAVEVRFRAGLGRQGLKGIEGMMLEAVRDLQKC